MRKNINFALRGLLVFTALAGFALAQQPAAKPALPANVESHKLDSKLMGRQMPYRIILPAAYGTEKDAKFPVLYLLHGLTGHFDNWTDRTKLAEYALKHRFIIVTPEGENGWYTDSPSDAKAKYESYIVQELIAEVEKKFRAATGRPNRAIAGLSMGGFGALKFGLKYPEMFVLAGSFSGALFASSYPTVEALPPGNIRMSLVAIFGSPDSDTQKANDIFRKIREASPETIKAMPYLYVDCGTEDFLFQNNRDFISLLVEKKIPHEYRQVPGAHDWKYWDKQIAEFLRVADARFSSK